jgi:hypothetical protein
MTSSVEDRLRRTLREVGDRVQGSSAERPLSTPGVSPEDRSRPSRRIIWAAAAVMVVAGAVGVAAMSTDDRAPDVPVVASETETTPAVDEPLGSTPTTSDRATCGAPALAPTFLPPSFDPELRPGSGGQITVDGGSQIVPRAEQPANHHHFRGPAGIYIDVLRGRETIAPIGASVGDPEPIDVLGIQGQIGNIHEGYGVRFDLGAGTCDAYLLAAFGVSRADLFAFAEGLEQAGPTATDRHLMAD